MHEINISKEEAEKLLTLCEASMCQSNKSIKQSIRWVAV